MTAHAAASARGLDACRSRSRHRSWSSETRWVYAAARSVAWRVATANISSQSSMRSSRNASRPPM